MKILKNKEDIAIGTKVPVNLIELKCACGEVFILSGNGWKVDIRGTWDFTCPCGNKLRINPKRVTEKNFLIPKKIPKLVCAGRVGIGV